METVFGSAISAGAGAGLLSTLVTVVQIVYLGVSFVPALAASTSWMNWLMVLVTPVFAAPLACMVARYPRLDADEGGRGGTSDVRRGGLDRAGCF